MRNLSLLLIVILLTSSIMAQTTPISPTIGIRDKAPEFRAFTNATIVVSPDKTISEATLIVRDGYIVDVGSNLTIPAGAEIIDLEGFTIYPGFIEPYSNYGLEKPKSGQRRGRNSSLQFNGTRKGGNAWNDAIHAETDWVHQFEPNKKESESFFSSGFTTVQSCKLDGIFRGRSFVTHLGDDLSNDLIISPLGLPFASFNKGSSKQEYPGSLMGSIALMRQMFLDLDWYQKAHRAYQLAPNQPMPEFNSAIVALAGQMDNTFVMQSDDELSLLRAQRVADEFGLKMIHLGSGYEYARLDEIVQTGASIILPIAFPDAPEISEHYDELDIRLSTLRHWDRAPQNPALLDQAGVQFSFTTEKLDKISEFLPAVRKAVKYGLSTSSALAAMTTHPAKFCGIDKLAGTLENGKLADFFITDGDIFDKDTKIFSVWVGGNKNKLNDMPGLDYRGKYDLAFGESNYEFTIKGEQSKLSGHLLMDDDEKKLKAISTSPEKLFFSFDFDTTSPSGVVRFSGKSSGGNLKGHGTYADGQEFEWLASYVGTWESEPDSTDSSDSTVTTDDEKKSDEKEKPVILSRLTYPNKAFGVDGLPTQEDLLITNVTLWTSEDDGILENIDVLVQDGKFASIGKDINAPSSIRVIDGTGKHLTAGIIDPHSHIAGSGNINECTEAVTAEVRIGDIINPDDISIYRQLAGGTTTSLILHGSCNAIGGQTQIIKLRWGGSSEQLKFENSIPTIKFALGENVKRSSWGQQHRIRYPQTRMGIENIIRDGFQAAIEYQTEWLNYNDASSSYKKKTIPPRRDIELETILEIINGERMIHCHSYVQTEILMLMRVAEQYGFHVQTFTHILEGYKVAPEMAAHGASGSSFSDWWAYKFEVYDAIPHNVALMTEKGVLSSINSDNASLGSRLTQEAAKSLKYGKMSREEVIKLCTINSAKQLRVDDRIGSVKVGKDADFVIWNGDPLSLYSHPEQTWIEGARYFDLKDDLIRRQQDQSEKHKLVQKLLADGGKKKKGGKGKGWQKGYKSVDRENHCDDSYDYWEEINNATY